MQETKAFQDFLKTAMFWEEESVSPKDVLHFMPIAISSILKELGLTLDGAERVCKELAKGSFDMFEILHNSE